MSPASFSSQRQRGIAAILLGLAVAVNLLAQPAFAQLESLALLPALVDKDRVRFLVQGYPIRGVVSTQQTWSDAFEQADPSFARRYTTRILATLDKIRENDERSDSLQSEPEDEFEDEPEPSESDWDTPRYVVLVRSQHTWIVPEFLFMEYVGSLLRTANGDVLTTPSKNAIDRFLVALPALDETPYSLQYDTNALQLEMEINQQSQLRLNTKRILDGSWLQIPGDSESLEVTEAIAKESLVLLAQREIAGSTLTVLVAGDQVALQGLTETRLHDLYRELPIIGRFSTLQVVSLERFLKTFSSEEARHQAAPAKANCLFRQGLLDHGRLNHGPILPRSSAAGR